VICYIEVPFKVGLKLLNIESYRTVLLLFATYRDTIIFIILRWCM